MDLDLEFEDTRLTEPDEEEFFSTADKITKLSDKLAEEILLDNIQEDLSKKDDFLSHRVNYVTYFKDRFNSIQPDDPVYDQDYMREQVARLGAIVMGGLKEKFGVELIEDLEYDQITEYLDNVETMYEFFFVRQYENINDYFWYKLMDRRQDFLAAYKPLINIPPHNEDLFVSQQKKKFKNFDDVIIIHFMNEIIQDIDQIQYTNQMYVMCDQIVNLDLYEVCNKKIYDFLQTYGNSFRFESDEDCVGMYFKPIRQDDQKIWLRNNLVMKYLETCEMNDED